MDPIARFQAYAAAFEQVFEDDDWSRLEPFFSEDAVYEIHAEPPFGGRHEGRESVFAELKRSLDRFDRRFETRQLELLEGPELRDGAVWMRWRVTYRVPDAPPLVMQGEESAELEGGRIRRLEDRFEDATQKDVVEFLGQHEAKLRSAPA